MTNTTIHSRALMVSLNLSTWSARRYDKTATDTVSRSFLTSSDAGRYNKFLLPGDAKSYKALMSLASSIRVAHYAKTLAWSDEGWRLLPTAQFSDYSTWIREQRAAFDVALDAFVAEYPSLRAEAKRKLNGLYADSDYPDASDIRAKFSMDVSYSPIPCADDIRVTLSDSQISDIETSITSRVQTATRIAVQDAWARLHDTVSHMAERLSQPDAIFRDSLVGNVREVCDVLKRLNVTDDADLEAMRQQVESELSHYSPATLRENAYTRAEAANKAQSIVDAMAGLYGPAEGI